MELIAGADDARIASWIAARLSAALAASESAVAISLPGGSTPFPILAELVKHPLAWERVVAFPGVPNPHEAVNGEWPAKRWKKIYKFIRPVPWIRQAWDDAERVIAGGN